MENVRKLYKKDFENLTEKQASYLEEFLSSKCDSFDSRDFYYYAEKTGKSIKWLMANASYSDEIDYEYYAEYDPDMLNLFI